MPEVHSSSLQIGPPRLVLDTNAVLDWLVFQDLAMKPLAQAITQSQVRWLASERMRQELAHVLARPWPSRWPFVVDDCLAQFDRWTTRAAEPIAAEVAKTMPGCVCTDPDDQVFIDLALEGGATWLVSRDLAVLRLSRRLATFGVVVRRPVDWQLSQHEVARAADRQDAPPAPLGTPDR